MKRRLKYCGIAAAVLGVVAAMLGISVYRTSVRLYYAYAGYANALGEYLATHGHPPDSLEELEAHYNAPGPRSAQLPPPAPYPRPEYYRPPEGQRGSYVAIVSPPSASSWTVYRVVVHTSLETRSARAELVFRWRVDDLIADDVD